MVASNVRSATNGSKHVNSLEETQAKTKNKINSNDDESISTNDNESLSIDCACAYCKDQTPSSLVQCLACRRWFCNSRASPNAPSHIVYHLVRARHREIQLHKESQLGDTVLECYNCNSKNVFILGFVAAKSDTVVILLCRQPCASSQNLAQALSIDTQRWQPLIENRALLPWLVPLTINDPKDTSKVQLTMKQIDRLEEIWKEKNKNNCKDEENNSALKLAIDDDSSAESQLASEPPLAPVRAKYEDGYQYQNVFGPLIKLEADYDKALKDTQTFENVTVRWDSATGGPAIIFAYFSLSHLDFGDLKLAIGDELVLSRDGRDARGIIIRLPTNRSSEYGLELRSKDLPPSPATSGYTVKQVWKSAPFDRMQRAFKRFALSDASCSGYLYHKLLGSKVREHKLETKLPQSFSAPNLPELNESQANAVKTVLQNPLSLIQGPPGTGKTVTSASIVYRIAQQAKGQILVCAPSNVAVDHLASKISLTGLRVVRVAARSREHIIGDSSDLSLHLQVRTSLKTEEYKSVLKLKEQQGELNENQSASLRKTVDKLENKILADADVICTTCVGAGDFRISKRKFRTILLDEATQATEPECLIPLVLGCQQVILVGDHEQLGPVIVNKRAASAGLQQSLFERLILLGNQPIRLTVQYRMHPCLSEFPSNMFYEGTLQNGVTALERSRQDVNFPWPVPDVPMMFHAIFGSEEISPNGTSFLNRAEATMCQCVIQRFFKEGIDMSQIGVITPYEGQRSYLATVLQQSGIDVDNDLEIASVDAFQGREKDFIIVSCVRSNDNQGIGFLCDPRRLNVALTRARYGLILLGNPGVLTKDPLWYNLLLHCKRLNTLVEGPLENMQPCTVELVKPKKKYSGPKRHHLVHDTQVLLDKGSQPSIRSIDWQLQKMNLSEWPALPTMT